MSDYKTILLDMAGSTATITMNTPQTLNALSDLTIHELSKALDQLEADTSIRVVLITGTGKAFIAGADISYMSQLTPEQARIYANATTEIYRKISESKKVFIAAVNGYALGGGCEFVLACDLCIASERAKFGLPEVSLGILPGGGGTQRLTRLVGIQKAKELILTAATISAEEALTIGLVCRVVPEEELLPVARELATKILQNAPQAVQYARECIQKAENMDLESGIKFENSMFGLCFATPDQKEGMQAFLEKRKANFHSTL